MKIPFSQILLVGLFSSCNLLSPEPKSNDTEPNLVDTVPFLVGDFLPDSIHTEWVYKYESYGGIAGHHTAVKLIRRARIIQSTKSGDTSFFAVDQSDSGVSIYITSSAGIFSEETTYVATKDTTHFIETTNEILSWNPVSSMSSPQQEILAFTTSFHHYDSLSAQFFLRENRMILNSGSQFATYALAPPCYFRIYTQGIGLVHASSDVWANQGFSRHEQIDLLSFNGMEANTTELETLHAE